MSEAIETIKAAKALMEMDMIRSAAAALDEAVIMLQAAQAQAPTNQQLLEAIKIAIECLGLHGDGFVDLGAMTVLQDFEAAVAAAQEQGK
jgi:hypothetical protein